MKRALILILFIMLASVAFADEIGQEEMLKKSVKSNKTSWTSADYKGHSILAGLGASLPFDDVKLFSWGVDAELRYQYSFNKFMGVMLRLGYEHFSIRNTTYRYNSNTEAYNYWSLNYFDINANFVLQWGAEKGKSGFIPFVALGPVVTIYNLSVGFRDELLDYNEQYDSNTSAGFGLDFMVGFHYKFSGGMTIGANIDYLLPLAGSSSAANVGIAANGQLRIRATIGYIF